MKQATITDFMYPEFRGQNPEDYEVRPDGKCVRKDRWEMGIRRIHSIFGDGRTQFEIEEVVAAVASLHANGAVIDRCEFGHKFAKLEDHPTRNGSPRCPHCLAYRMDSLDD